MPKAVGRPISSSTSTAQGTGRTPDLVIKSENVDSIATKPEVGEDVEGTSSSALEAAPSRRIRMPGNGNRRSRFKTKTAQEMRDLSRSGLLVYTEKLTKELKKTITNSENQISVLKIELASKQNAGSSSETQELKFQIAYLQQQGDQKDKELEEKNKELAIKDEQIAAKDRQISANDEQIKDWNRNVSQLIKKIPQFKNRPGQASLDHLND